MAKGGGLGISTTKAQHDFSRVPKAEISRSVFDRSCGHKTTFDAGLLVPVFVDQALPGDTFEMSAAVFGRVQTLKKPIMDNMYMDVHFWFVPHRLVWDNFVKMMGEQDNPGDSVDFLVPQIAAPVSTGWAELSLADYFGIPTKVATLECSALPFRAYQLIYDQWYRDQNLQTGTKPSKGNGPDAATTAVLRRRGKRHDYFTSCLPFAQKGTAVSLPLGTTAKVLTGAEHATAGFPYAAMLFRRVDTAAFPAANNITGFTTGGQFQTGTGTMTGVATLFPSNLYADLSTATAATINQLRQAFQIQRLLERDARGGTRYTESIKAHFGVTSPDARLQRPEYLGGGTVPIGVKPVETTFASAAPVQSVGDLGATGQFGGAGFGFRQSFTEHGTVIGLASVRADLTYQQGLERQWSWKTRFDFPWPALMHLGEQAVLNKEIYAKNDANDVLTFGYQERYAECRYKPSIVTGRFRSNATAPLDVWHLAQSFSALPALNAAFIEENPPMDRVITVSTEPDFIADFFFKFRCARPMPVYSVPGLTDHF